MHLVKLKQFDAKDKNDHVITPAQLPSSTQGVGDHGVSFRPGPQRRAPPEGGPGPLPRELRTVRIQEDTSLEAKRPEHLVATPPLRRQRAPRPLPWRPAPPSRLPRLLPAPPWRHDPRKLPHPSRRRAPAPPWRPAPTPCGVGAQCLPAMHGGAVASDNPGPGRPPGGCEEWLRGRNAPGLRAVRAPGEPRLLRKAGPPPARAAGQVRPTRGGGGESAGPRVRWRPAPCSFPLPPPAVPLGPCPVLRRPTSSSRRGLEDVPETPPYGQYPAGACGRVTECAQK